VAYEVGQVLLGLHLRRPLPVGETRRGPDVGDARHPGLVVALVVPGPRGSSRPIGRQLERHLEVIGTKRVDTTRDDRGAGPAAADHCGTMADARTSPRHAPSAPCANSQRCHGPRVFSRPTHKTVVLCGRRYFRQNGGRDDARWSRRATRRTRGCCRRTARGEATVERLEVQSATSRSPSHSSFVRHTTSRRAVVEDHVERLSPTKYRLVCGTACRDTRRRGAQRCGVERERVPGESAAGRSEAATRFERAATISPRGQGGAGRGTGSRWRAGSASTKSLMSPSRRSRSRRRGSPVGGLAEHRPGRVDATTWRPVACATGIATRPFPIPARQRPVRLASELHVEGDVVGHVSGPFVVSIRELSCQSLADGTTNAPTASHIYAVSLDVPRRECRSRRCSEHMTSPAWALDAIRRVLGYSSRLSSAALRS